jgi:hypothetical protein
MGSYNDDNETTVTKTGSNMGFSYDDDGPYTINENRIQYGVLS